jgi:hypothetical protein
MVMVPNGIVPNLYSWFIKIVAVHWVEDGGESCGKAKRIKGREFPAPFLFLYFTFLKLVSFLLAAIVCQPVIHDLPHMVAAAGTV